MIQQILQALNYMHARGIIHRDVSPENILLDSNKEMELKIIGFSSSQYQKKLE